MIKKVLTVVLICTMLLSVCSFSAGAEQKFTLDATLNFSSDSISLDISGSTPAKYGQLISIVVYEIDAPEDVLVENPAVIFPLTNIQKVVRLEEIAADYDGNYTASLSFNDVADSKYFVVQATGGGLANAGATASQFIYYEKTETIDTVTLPEFKTVQEDGLEELLKSKQLLLGYLCDSDYESKKDDIHSLFVSVRDEDYPENFKSIKDVQTALKSVDVLLSLRANPSTPQAEDLIKSNKEMLSFDFNDTDYTENESEIYKTFAGFLNKKYALPGSMSDTTVALKQATGIVVINDLNATQMKDVIEKYADVFGIDIDDYTKACKTYGTNKVNMAFVERNFENPSEILIAYSDRIDTLKEENKEKTSKDSGKSSGQIKSAAIGNEIIAPSNSAKYIYNDITSDHWAYEAISYLSKKGVLSGFGDGSFAPDNVVTREQFVKMIVEAFEIKEDYSLNSFSDVDTDRWSAKYVSAAAGAGVISGIGDRKFAPENPVTRQDAAVILKRVCDKYGVNLLNNVLSFADKSEIASYAQESVGALSAAGIIAGFEDGTFRPAQALTRAQAAKVVHGLIK